MPEPSFLSVFGPAILVCAWTLLAAWGWGGLARRIALPGAGGLLERLGLRLALGLGACSLAIAWCLLAIRAYWIEAAKAWLWAGAALSVGFAVARAKTVVRAPWRAPRISPAEAAACLPLAAALALAWAASLAPSVNYDALEYHLAVPRAWIESKSFAPDPWMFYSQLPFGAETLFALGMLGDPASAIGPKANQFALFLAACLCVGALARRLGASRPMSLLAAANFAVHWTVVRVYLDAFADLAAGLFGAALALALLAACGKKAWREAASAGFLGGCALSAKTAAAGVAVAPAALFLLLPRAWSPGGSRAAAASRALFSLLIFGAAAGLAFAPWPIRNAMWTGNPAAPFMNAWFGADAWMLSTERFWLGMHGWNAPFSPEHWQAIGSRIGMIGWPWALGAVLALAAGGAEARLLAGTALAGYAAYCLLAGAPDRFATPLIALAIPLAHAAAQRLGRWSGRLRPAWRWIAPALMLMAMAAPLRRAALVSAAQGNIAFLARASADPESAIADYMKNSLGMTADLFRAINERTPSDARILCLYEARTASIRRDRLANSVFDKAPWLEIWRARQEGETLAHALRRAGFTHLLVHEYELGRLVSTHATPEARSDPLYRQIAGIEDPTTRLVEFGRRPQWYAPHSRMEATPEELGELAALLNRAMRQAIFLEYFGPLRLMACEIPG
ncbi:MAG: hypothetical protein BWZ10_01237 [candidate division BRC1 bacterium ADurb.BinA364]|nr:MAG: hypothetical protein BWZ10_01237 [candidate division BRC1 bacterium ADurb.BinA364]